MATVTCPSCGQRSRVPGPGRYACSGCKAVLPTLTAAPQEPARIARATHPDSSGQPQPTRSETTGPTADAPTPGAAGIPPADPAKVAAIEDRIEADPRGRASYLQLAQVYIDAGHNDLAIGTLERYLTLDPDNAFIQQRVATLRRRPAKVRPSPTTRRSRVDAAAVERRHRTGKRRMLLAIAALPVLTGLFLLWPVLFPPARPLVTETWTASLPRFAPDGRQLAYIAAREGRYLDVLDLDDGARRSLAPIDGYELAWSPDGQKIAFVSNVELSDEEYWGEAIHVVYAIGGEVRRVALGNAPSWSPDGTRLAHVCRRSQTHTYVFEGESFTTTEWGEAVCVTDLASGVETVIAEQGRKPGFAPDGGLVAFELTGEWRELDLGDAGGTGTGRDFVDFAEDVVTGGDDTFGGTRNSLEREAESEMYADEHEVARTTLPPQKVDIWATRPDGSGTVQLTFDGRSSDPRWTAAGRLVYVFHGDDGPALWSMLPDGTDRRPLTPPGLIIDPTRAELAGNQIVYLGRVETANEVIAMTVARTSPVDVYSLELGDDRPRRIETQHAFKGEFAVAPDGSQLVYAYTNPDTGAGELWLTGL